MSSIRLKRVLITGAARGIGWATARRFAQGGADIILTDMDAAAAAEARDKLVAEGARCLAYGLDVTDENAIRGVRDQIHADAGEIDILVNNAGVVFGGPFLDVPLERHRLTYRVNVEGVMAMTYVFLPDLIASPRGHLVNIASASGFIGLPNGATYASSKWAVIGFSESVRLEMKRLRHKNVDVTTVCPTFVATGMFEGAAPPKTTTMLSPEEIAAKVVEAVEKQKIWVLEPWIVKITPFLKNCLPTGLSDFISDAFGANSSMDSWRGRKSEPAQAADAR